MQAITTVGLNITKSVFQVHGVDAAGKVIIRRQLKRQHVLAFFQRLPACVVGMEGRSVNWCEHRRVIFGRSYRKVPTPNVTSSAYVGKATIGEHNEVRQVGKHGCVRSDAPPNRRREGILRAVIGGSQLLAC